MPFPAGSDGKESVYNAGGFLGREDLEKEMATTPPFLPRKSYGQRSLVPCGPWGCKESDTTGHLTHMYVKLSFHASAHLDAS